MENDNNNSDDKPKTNEVKKGNSLTLLILIAVAVLIAGSAYAYYKKTTLPSITGIPEETSEEITTQEIREPIEEAPQPTETTTSARTDEEEERLIKLAVLERTELEADEITFTITSRTEMHAKGNIKEIEAVGGGYWLAAKDETGNWIAVYDGQANPPCEDVDMYEFPVSMVPECLDESNDLVTR